MELIDKKIGFLFDILEEHPNCEKIRMCRTEEECPDPHDDGSYCECCMRDNKQWLIEQIKEINDQPTVNTWISVDKRLPKIEEEVLVLTDSGRLLGNLEKSGIWWFDEWSTTLENPNKGIIAWMPIPEFSKEKQ